MPKKKTISNSLLELEKEEEKLLKLGKDLLSTGDGIYPVDLVVFGGMKRTLSNMSGFIELVKLKNMVSAGSLLRIQIDTFMRFYALTLVDSPNNLAKDMISGLHIRNIKDSYGKKMTDTYLIKLLSKDCPWLKEVYGQLSGYIHFSNKHLFDSVDEIDKDKLTLSFNISKKSNQYPESSWVEIVNYFTHSVRIFLFYVKGWLEMKINIKK